MEDQVVMNNLTGEGKGGERRRIYFLTLGCNLKHDNGLRLLDNTNAWCSPFLGFGTFIGWALILTVHIHCGTYRHYSSKP